MNKHVRKTIESRVAKLRENTAYQERQIEFLTNRLAGFQADLDAEKNELLELLDFVALDEFLSKTNTAGPSSESTLTESTPSQSITNGCKFHSSPDVTPIPQHTNVIVG